MNKRPEFDPFIGKSGTPVEGQPGVSDGDEELPSFEGVVFSPYLTPADLDGTNWDVGKTIPEFPLRIWEVPGPEEDGDLRTMPSTSQYSVPVKLTVEERAGSKKLVMDWLEPPEQIAHKLTPLGRQKPAKARPGLYGNLADTSWLSINRLKPVSGAAEEDPDQPRLVDDAAVKAVDSVETVSSINDIPVDFPSHPASRRPPQSQTSAQSPGIRENKMGRA
ncbi:MAG: hypothetical protein ABSG96_10455 [Terracidiphilus sp.]|jgi:hypothetical protein